MPATQRTTPRNHAELAPPRVLDLGRMPYAEAYAMQIETHAEVVAAREQPASAELSPGVILLVEHDPPVITVSRRPGARDHLLAAPEALAARGVTVAETDRGGDITYHGLGQLVVYPILDLNALGWNLHRYMRELEHAVIAACARFGVEAHRDARATGVWVGGGAGESTDPETPGSPGAGAPGAPGAVASGGAKICAMGVRVRRWVTMHGLALNVTTNLDHFGLIVPCGLAGRPVTSLQRLLGPRCPTMPEVKRVVVEELARAAQAPRPTWAEAISRS